MCEAELHHLRASVQFSQCTELPSNPNVDMMDQTAYGDPESDSESDTDSEMDSDVDDEIL